MSLKYSYVEKYGVEIIAKHIYPHIGNTNIEITPIRQSRLYEYIHPPR